MLDSDAYRRRDVHDIFRDLDDSAPEAQSSEALEAGAREKRPYFEVLVVDRISPEEEDAVRSSMLGMRREDDEFIYDVVFVPSCEDAIIAVLFNHNIQAA